MRFQCPNRPLLILIISSHFFVPGGHSESSRKIEEKILELARDRDPRVRFQAALTLGEVDLPGRVAALASIAREDSADPWVRNAILSSIGSDTAAFLETLISEERAETSGVDTLVGELAKLLGTKGKTEEIGRLLMALSGSSTNEALQIVSLDGLSEGLQLSGIRVEGGASLAAPLAELLIHPSARIRNAAVEISAKALPQDSPELSLLIDDQIQILQSIDLDGEKRVQSAKLLRLGSFERVSESLFAQLTSQSHDALQIAVIETLSTYDLPAVGETLIERWSQLGPQAKGRALDALLSRNDRANQLLDAIESEAIPANVLDSQKQTLLISYSDPSVSEKAKRIFSSLSGEENADLYRQYSDAVSLAGDRAKGKKIYIERCAQCHIAEGEGHQLGPDWSGLKSNTRETLLTSILYPNREVDPGFTNYILETVDGDIFTGVLSFSGPNSVILRRGGGQEDTILRKNIDFLEDTKMSIMPTNLEVGLSTQDMADLLSFIETLQ